ncbi:arsenate reductase ArsC [Erysipelothrix rhusiopathiae]|nr:arsenate reductase ArsC [Erysipelothrix rhusiopathiae]MDE8269042.1 arsenate reductase ArsC [Erysipelothrix rhusiopathiae]MDE8270689.1 arsenate reductase ArsC [Erysipelothrix rhusiopathiae]MDE8279114.1 arsenate reductase ArsC [Erysipelothrix rhusiopathiae]MDE8319400.1 arsenate reductase ArsC [Erysipelothrix rhusiopathiae]
MKPKVAFICVHNSCRSQMAEAVSKLLASDTFEGYSAGTHRKDQINSDAVKIVKKHYDYDMSVSQKPKVLEDIPEVDIVITMGCNVDCPFLPSKHREDWGLDDPSGLGDEAFELTLQTITTKVNELKKRIQEGSIKWK